MGRKKRRSSKFRDSSTIIDIEQARQERQKRQAERHRKKKKMEARSKPARSGGAVSRETVKIPEAAYRPESDPSWEESVSWEGPETSDNRTQNGPDTADTSNSATGSVADDMAGEAGIRQDRRRMALRRRKRNRAMIVMGVVLALVILVGFSLGNIVMLKYDLHVAKKEQEQYKEEKAQLEEDMLQINDLDSLEEQARDQMRLIKPGETLYIFPEYMTPQGEDTEDPDDSQDKDKQEVNNQ